MWGYYLTVPSPKVSGPDKYKIIFLTFFECGLKGEWKDQPMWDMHYYTPLDDQNELWIVRPDGLKRAFRFKEGSTIKIAQNLVKFDVGDVIEEIAVDEDERKSQKSYTNNYQIQPSKFVMHYTRTI